jgi:hypothetical protein
MPFLLCTSSNYGIKWRIAGFCTVAQTQVSYTALVDHLATHDRRVLPFASYCDWIRAHPHPRGRGDSLRQDNKAPLASFCEDAQVLFAISRRPSIDIKLCINGVGSRRHLFGEGEIERVLVRPAT